MKAEGGGTEGTNGARGAREEGRMAKGEAVAPPLNAVGPRDSVAEPATRQRGCGITTCADSAGPRDPAAGRHRFNQPVAPPLAARGATPGRSHRGRSVLSFTRALTRPPLPG